MTEISNIIQSQIVDDTRMLMMSKQIEQMIEDSNCYCHQCGQSMAESFGGFVSASGEKGRFRCDECRGSGDDSDDSYNRLRQNEIDNICP